MVSAAARKGIIITALIAVFIGAVLFLMPIETHIGPAPINPTTISATLLVAEQESGHSLIRIDEVYSQYPQECFEPGSEIEAVFTYGIQGGESHGYDLPRLEEGSRFSANLRNAHCEPPYIGAYSLIE